MPLGAPTSQEWLVSRAKALNAIQWLISQAIRLHDTEERGESSTSIGNVLGRRFLV